MHARKDAARRSSSLRPGAIAQPANPTAPYTRESQTARTSLNAARSLPDPRHGATCVHLDADTLLKRVKTDQITHDQVFPHGRALI